LAPAVLMDTSLLVAFVAGSSEYGEWTRCQFKRHKPPLLTCEPVSTEAAFLLKRDRASAYTLFQLLDRGVLSLEFSLTDQMTDVHEFMGRYRDTPRSLRDASLVRMAEINPQVTVSTLKRYFRVYRKHERLVVPVLTP